MAPSDEDLMARVREGDDLAFRELFERHAGAIVRYCAGFLGNAARAEEVAQEVFLRVHRARGRWEPRARFTTWLYTIAQNLCRNEARRPERHLMVEAVGPDGEGGSREFADPVASTGDEHAAASELEHRLRGLLAGLPPAQRAALLLSRAEGLRYEVIGEVLGVSEEAVKSLIFRATRSLRAGLKDLMGTGQ